MRYFITISVFLAAFDLAGHSQHPFEIGGEYMRSMGKGFKDNIAGVRGETFSNKSSFNVGITYQFSSKSSYSTAKGFGIFGGYRYAFGSNTNGNNLFVGAKILFNLLSWEGKSSLFSPLITPIAEAGYHLTFAKQRLFAAPAVGYGFTLRVIPDYNSLDEDAGGRFIPGISAGYRF